MARIDQHLARLQARRLPWPLPWRAVDALGRKEDCRLVAYLCSAGVPTIGWGETEAVQLGMRWTEDQVDARFHQQVVKFTHIVESMLTRPATPNQLGALVMLAYNIGLGAFKTSTVLRLHNAGDFEGAARAFGLFNKARDPITKQLRVVPGLTARRLFEAALYLEPEDGAPAPRMPQAVEGESSLAASPLVKLGVSAIGSGGVVGVTAVEPASPAPSAAVGAADQLAQVGQLAGQASDTASAVVGVASSVKAGVHALAGFLHMPPLALLAIGLVGIGAGVIYWRTKQRREGWA